MASPILSFSHLAGTWARCRTGHSAPVPPRRCCLPEALHAVPEDSKAGQGTPSLTRDSEPYASPQRQNKLWTSNRFCF